MSVINASQDKRRHRRVPVKLNGRLMLTTRQEAPCRAIDMSPGGISLETDVRVRRGERVIAYIDEIGRIEGLVARSTRGGFAMTITATSRKRDKFAETLTFQANREALDIEMRAEPRSVLPPPVSEFVLADGSAFVARMTNVSVSGGAAISKAPLTVGMRAWIDGRQCEILRSSELEFAFRFV